ncbi:RloB family protein [Burkholderia cenocepacia]|uniref:RloB family protein n=1 Tax=Burkholderia cenocepacia TaxID=95486 RepID=UPI0028B4AA92|nr:RloB family protein [Burkholderia cenocepacia]MDT6993832.1 RloB family protein [Burkholderia cenocepacia]
MALNIKQRSEGKRKPPVRILIVCEGEKTEPGYFNGFRVAGEVCDVRGLGANALSLVREANKIYKKGDYTEVWCVFDRDSFPRKNVIAALNQAAAWGFKCAFSNESFELWYVLHFCYLDTQITRKDYCDKLSGFLDRKYRKNDPLIFDELSARQEQAIKASKKLFKNIVVNGVERADARPHTSVHELVERLRALERSIGR